MTTKNSSTQIRRITDNAGLKGKYINKTTNSIRFFIKPRFPWVWGSQANWPHRQKINYHRIHRITSSGKCI